MVFKKLTKKGFYTYSFLNSFQKFDEPLPPLGIERKNTLTGTVDITPDQYNRAVSIFDAFAWRNLGDYYLQTDVFLLAGILEKFRNVCRRV